MQLHKLCPYDLNANPSSTPTSPPLPDKVGVDGLEDKWRTVWDEDGTYKSATPATARAVYSIDTRRPPSPVRCVGHVFSYTHTDVIARYKRMRGYDVFTRWVGMTTACLPSAACRTTMACAWTCLCLTTRTSEPPFRGTDGRRLTPRIRCRFPAKNFIELCERLTAQDEKLFEAPAQAGSVHRLVADPPPPSVQHPQWRGPEGPSCATSPVARPTNRTPRPVGCDLPDRRCGSRPSSNPREYPGFYHQVAFRFEDGTPIYIETTRPELLAACTSLIANPNDERYKRYFGQYVYSPLFQGQGADSGAPAARNGQRVPVSPCAVRSVM